MGSGALAELAYKAIRRGGKAVIVGVARATDAASIKPMGMVFEEKTLQGSYFGSCVPRVDFPRMLQLYMAGKLKLDELITEALQDRRSAAGLRRPGIGQERARRDRLLAWAGIGV